MVFLVSWNPFWWTASSDEAGPQWCVEFVLDNLAHFAGLPVLLVLSAFFSGSETALFNLEGPLVKSYRTSTHRIEQTIAHLLEDRHRLLVTILFGNLVVNILFYSLCTVLVLKSHEQGRMKLAGTLGVGSLFAVIIFGEIMPKAIAYRGCRWFSRMVALPLYGFLRLIKPMRGALEWLANGLTSPFRKRTSLRHLTGDELEAMIKLSADEGHIDRHEQVVLERVLSSCELKVRDIMVARVDMACFDLDHPVAEFYDLARTSHHTNIPVYHDVLTNLEGVINVRDVLREKPTTTAELKRLVRPVVYVPETKTVTSLLTDFRKGLYGMAIAVDEYGTIEGMVTVEDVVEEIVGPIVDEFDPYQQPEVREVGERHYEVMGDMHVSDFEEAFDVELEKSPAVTIGGFVVYLMDKVPRVGDRVSWQGVEFTVRKVHRRRIIRLLVRVSEGGTMPDTGAPKPDTGGEVDHD